MTFLLLTVHFLDHRYHGLLGRKGPREWPPSPFRLFSALVAGIARHGELETDIGKSLVWLQKSEPPIIITPKAKTGQAITRFVPNNDGDKKPDQQERLTGKLTIPSLMLLNPDEKPQIHYLWDVNDKNDIPFDRIRDAARSLTTLGWGIDMAFADVKKVTEDGLQKIPGIRWLPKPKVWRDYGMLRVPIANAELNECTLCDLINCHYSSINRIENGKPLHTVMKPRIFDRVFYTSIERPLNRPIRLFELRNTDGSRFRYPHRKFIHIAGMVRHLVIEAMSEPGNRPRNVEDDWVETYIAGHCKGRKSNPYVKNKCSIDTDEKQPSEETANIDAHRQLSYLPLPSVGDEHADPGVRRFMISAPVGDDEWLDLIARRLAGQALKPVRGDEFGNGELPIVVPIPKKGDGVTRCYTTPASEWYSFTPVILPGHDDHKPEKTRKLIEKALTQSGIEQPCDFEWSAFSYFRKSFSAHKYDKQKQPQGYIRPSYLLSNTAVHLTLRFHDGTDQKNPIAVPGPITIGAGRHCGFGLMAKYENKNRE